MRPNSQNTTKIAKAKIPKLLKIEKILKIDNKAENRTNTEIIKNTESTKNTENYKNVEIIKDIKNTQNLKNAENIENIADVKNNAKQKPARLQSNAEETGLFHFNFFMAQSLRTAYAQIWRKWRQKTTKVGLRVRPAVLVALKTNTFVQIRPERLLEFFRYRLICFYLVNSVVT